MYMAWKVLLPIAMVLVVAIGVLVMLPATRNGFFWDRYVGWLVFGGIFIYLLVGLLRAVQWSRTRIRTMATS